jgi:hypothetical protein
MKKWISLLGIVCIMQSISAQNDYIPTPENLEARKWF